MFEITVCVGSSCHLKGAYDVIKALQKAIAEHGLEAIIEMKAGFCLGNCVNGVAVLFGERLMLSINPLNVNEMFEQYVLPEVKHHVS